MGDDVRESFIQKIKGNAAINVNEKPSQEAL
jgi:hypothetical protein